MGKINSDEMILEYINTFVEENGVPPSYREIAARFNISKSTVNKHLTWMKEKGLVDFEGHRSIRTKETQITKNESVKVPVLGRVSCGVPQYAEANIEEYVRLPVSIFGRGDFYILRAHGDSMIDIGIEEDDLVLIKHQNYAEAGEVVVALIGDEANLKRFFPEPEKHRIRLHPENATLKDQYYDSVEIQGVAVKVLKDIK